MSKTKTLVLLGMFLISIILIFTSCSGSTANELTATYDTMLKAVQAVVDSEDKDFAFSNCYYMYEDQDSYDGEQPAYVIVLSDRELDGNELTSYKYIVSDEIELTDTMTITIPDAMIEVIESNDTDMQEYLNSTIAGYEDLTHKVVDLAREQGRNLDEDAFSAGNSLTGGYEGSEFYVTILGDDTGINVKATYNIETEELVVAESIDSPIFFPYFFFPYYD